MKKYFFLVIFFVIFFVSWTSAYASEWLTIPTILSIFLLVVFILSFLSIKRNFNFQGLNIYKENIVLLIFIIAVTLIALIKPNDKTYNYLLAYYFNFFLTFWLSEYVIINYSKTKFILNVNLFAIIFVSIFGSTDFLLQVFAGFKVQDYIPRNVPSISIFGALGFPRNTGFCEEPTYFAWYYNCLGLIAVWHLYRIRIWLILKIFFTVVILFSYLTTFSSAGIPFLILFSSFYTLLFSKKRLYFIVGMLITVLLFIAASQIDEDFDLIAPVIEKLSLEGDSGEDRNDNWVEGWAAFKENPFLGKGLGYYSSINRQSFLNYYLFLSTEVGIIPTCIFCLFLYYVFKKIWRYKGEGRVIFLISFSCGAAHLLTQSSFYMPYFWLMIVFINKILADFYKNFTINERKENISLGAK
jgi:O-antigen ligase